MPYTQNEQALVNAMEQRNLQRMDELIQQDTNINIKDKMQHTLLMQAVLKEDRECTHRLLQAKQLHLEEEDAEGNTALMLAIKNGDWGMADILLKKGANINTRDKMGFTPLLWAMHKNDDNCVFYLLLNNPTKQRLEFLPDTNGDTLLMWAIKNKHWLTVQRLLDAGFDKNIQNNAGYTPIMLLLKFGSEIIVNHLLTSGSITTEDIQRAKELNAFMEVIKKTGHVIGFKTRVYGIKPEGMPQDATNSLLEHYLDILPKVSTLDCSDIKNAFQLAKTGTVWELIKQYQSGNCTIIPIACRTDSGGHGLTLVAWNDVLVVCNRGYGSFNEHISVFKIPNPPGRIPEDFFRDMMPSGPEPAFEHISNRIRGLIGEQNIDNPLLTFSSLEQQYGTCGFVNLKASLQPILCFMKLLQNNGRQFNYEFLESYLPNHPHHDQLKKIMGETRREYKEFTKAMRDQMVDELCAEFKKLLSDPEAKKETQAEAKKVYLALFSAILQEHHGQEKNKLGHPRSSEKREAELIRLLKILEVMTPEEKREILRTGLVTSALLAAAQLKKWDLVKRLEQQTGIASQAMDFKSEAPVEQDDLLAPLKRRLSHYLKIEGIDGKLLQQYIQNKNIKIPEKIQYAITLYRIYNSLLDLRQVLDLDDPPTKAILVEEIHAVKSNYPILTGADKILLERMANKIEKKHSSPAHSPQFFTEHKHEAQKSIKDAVFKPKS